MPKKVSLKEIVKAIDAALAELERTSGKTATLQDDSVERAKKVLKGVRESVEGICFPVMDVPTDG